MPDTLLLKLSRWACMKPSGGRNKTKNIETCLLEPGGLCIRMSWRWRHNWKQSFQQVKQRWDLWQSWDVIALQHLHANRQKTSSEAQANCHLFTLTDIKARKVIHSYILVLYGKYSALDKVWPLPLAICQWSSSQTIIFIHVFKIGSDVRQRNSSDVTISSWQQWKRSDGLSSCATCWPKSNDIPLLNRHSGA